MTKFIDLELDLNDPGDPNGSNDSNSEFYYDLINIFMQRTFYVIKMCSKSFYFKQSLVHEFF